MKCNICNNLMEEGESFFICQRCGYVIKEKVYSKEKQYERYLSHNYDDNYVYYMKNLTKNIDFAGKTVLDFGCGQHPCLSDIYPNAKFTNYDLFFYPSEKYKQKKYDLILIIEVIEHLENPYGIIKKLSNLLNEKGKILIHTMLYNETTDFKKWWYVRDITHISFFKAETFDMICYKLNLKKEFMDGFIVLSKN